MNKPHHVDHRIQNGITKRCLTIVPIDTPLPKEPRATLRRCSPCGTDYGTFRTSCPTCGYVASTNKTRHWQNDLIAKHCYQEHTSVGPVVITTVK